MTANEDFIRAYQVEDKSICKDVINWFDSNESELAKPGKTSDGYGLSSINTHIKDSMDISISLHDAYKHKELATALDVLPNAVNQYLGFFPLLEGCYFGIVENINIQKYTPPDGGFHLEHCERQSISCSSRMLVWMLYLNTINNGGGTEFTHYDKIEKAEEGKILIWPSDFTHAHRGIKSATETKYIMTGWYNFLA